jgi:phage baseplate assembly protein W
MLKEIYTRDPSDPFYRPDVFEIESDLETLLGQIRMLLYTKPGEVIGMIPFGVDLESMVFSTNLTNSAVEEKVRSAIYNYCPDADAFDVQIQVQFFYGTTRDICVIDILIDGTKYLGILLK